MLIVLRWAISAPWGSSFYFFLYARLQTGRIMVWWCPSVRPSVRPFSALFSYMLWHNELKFCTWLCFNVIQIKFECHHFASIFEGVMPSDSPSVRVSVRPFSALFSYMLWHIELKFCIWLCFTVLQIKFKCRQFPSIFVGVMPLLECRILKIHSFHTFLLHALTYWAEILHFTLFYCTTDQVWVPSISVNFCRSYAPFGI